MDNAASSTQQKALALNLDATTYGTFAEIGGGQEVARWFFSVGGEAGTPSSKPIADGVIDVIRADRVVAVWTKR